MTDWKALCEELVDALACHYPGHVDDDELIKRARAALAGEAVGEGPTDEELLEINDGAYCPCTDEVNDEDDSSWQYTSGYIRWLDENGTPEEQGAYAAKGLRAVFNAGRRYGNQPEPPAAGEVCKEEIDCETCGGSGTIDETLGGYGDSNPAATCPDCDGIGVITVPAPVPAGEVAELVAWLRAWARGTLEEGQPATSRSLTRAADLLEQRHPAPVPVAERLPGPGDCHFNPGAEVGSCWCFNPVEHLGGIAWWSFKPLEWSESATHWLPAHALPLPAGEVEP